MEDVVKKLIAVHPKPSYDGRRSAAIAIRSPRILVKSIDSNLIVIVVSSDELHHWNIVMEHFLADKLEYITELLFQLAEEEWMEQLKMIK